MDLTQAAKTILEPLGFEVLELGVSGRGEGRSVLLRIDRLDGGVVAMNDVSLASEVFGLELDRLDPFEGRYKLEVESPGPERPLKTTQHFRRFQGLLAKVRAGGETFRGKIRTVEGESVSFEVNGETRTLALNEIKAWLAEWPETPR
ncbi:MAG: ribosome maturation factor RimP [Deinococcota bacterium]|nr:ribosome maturation factor RimP [Deinococcota bacterium]